MACLKTFLAVVALLLSVPVTVFAQSFQGFSCVGSIGDPDCSKRRAAEQAEQAPTIEHSTTTITTEEETITSPVIVPIVRATSAIWKGLKVWRGKTKTNGKTGKDREYYEWDNTHGEIEVYDRRGQHKGVIDPTTGEQIKSPVKGRSIDVD